MCVSRVWVVTAVWARGASGPRPGVRVAMRARESTGVVFGVTTRLYPRLFRTRARARRRAVVDACECESVGR
eukprot:1903595-Rhodomonas_salina.1